MVSADVARLAARVRPEKLILFHLSDRYTHAEWLEQLEEVRAVFPATYFRSHGRWRTASKGTATELRRRLSCLSRQDTITTMRILSIAENPLHSILYRTARPGGGQKSAVCRC